ncbi:MAG: hypothetical protein K6F24_04315 [Atopobiaceae bacterium]|nr:hypothetical protein [Atopobiaceae bacterium]
MDSFFNLTKGEKVSDIEIPDKKSAKDFILSELNKRYDEDFIQVDGTEITAYDPDEDREICYEMLVAPKTQPSKVFTSMVYTNVDTNKQVFPVMDNYQQYLFTPIVCKPFEEYLVNQDSIDGYAVKLTWNKMDDEVWTADQVEQYMGLGVDGDPVVGMLIMVARTSPEEVAQIIYDAHISCAQFNRNMRLVFGLTGCDMRDSKNNIYGTHLDYMYFNTRKNASFQYTDIVKEVANQMKIVKETGWDGIGRVGDPNNAVSSVTWKQKKQ